MSNYCIAIGDRSNAEGDYVFAFSANGKNYSTQMTPQEQEVVARVVRRAVNNPGPLAEISLLDKARLAVWGFQS